MQTPSHPSESESVYFIRVTILAACGLAAPGAEGFARDAALRIAANSLRSFAGDFFALFV
jgi:hypothetical protein